MNHFQYRPKEYLRAKTLGTRMKNKVEAVARPLDRRFIVSSRSRRWDHLPEFSIAASPDHFAPRNLFNRPVTSVFIARLRKAGTTRATFLADFPTAAGGLMNRQRGEEERPESAPSNKEKVRTVVKLGR